MERRLEGRARVFGDDVNTDYVIASSRKRDTLDPEALSRYLMETVDPDFAASVEPGDVIVAGENFGCGSAMEVAVTVPLAAGIRAVVAKSFARSYFRNAVNNGLLPVECDTDGIREGDALVIDVSPGGIEVRDRSRDLRRRATGFPPMLLRLLDAGGLVPFVREHGTLRPDAGAPSGEEPG